MKTGSYGKWCEGSKLRRAATRRAATRRAATRRAALRAFKRRAAHRGRAVRRTTTTTTPRTPPRRIPRRKRRTRLRPGRRLLLADGVEARLTSLPHSGGSVVGLFPAKGIARVTEGRLEGAPQPPPPPPPPPLPPCPCGHMTVPASSPKPPSGGVAAA